MRKGREAKIYFNGRRTRTKNNGCGCRESQGEVVVSIERGREGKEKTVAWEGKG